ncbi:MAG: signal peptide peptidase SppA [Thermoguttaceae bacterium]|nr:signal peptide peptidase SppA [Thermoguttaceae bacterium]
MNPENADQIADKQTLETDDVSTPRPNAPNASNSTPNPNFAPNVATRPTTPFRVPPRPIGFWALFFKDVTTSVAGVATFCFLSFFLFFAAIVGLAGALSDSDESSLVVEETIFGDDDAPGKIVVLPIEGTIETDEYGFLREAIDCIADDERVRGVVLRINSPGGTIAGSDYYYALLQDLKAELDVPIIASMGDVAASGGYYIATAADQIFAERSTLTGSIGVIVSMYDASELCEKVGVASTPVVSGPMKGMGDFMKKPTPEETAVWQALVDESYEQFLDVVRAGRPWYRGATEKSGEDKENSQNSENGEDEAVGEKSEGDEPVETALAKERDAELRRVADGRIYTAKQALELRLIDEIGFLDDAIDAAIEAAGLTPETAEVVRYEELESWTSALGLSALTKRSEPLEQALDSVATPRGYYLIPRAFPTTVR